MKDKLRIVQYGCGKMATYLMRYVFEKGAEIVAAFDIKPELIDRDIAVVMGGDKRGVTIQDAAGVDSALREIKPDACVVATRSLLKDVKDILLICADNGVNTVTTCDEALFPWNSSPNLAREIDERAKKSNCTITGSGFPDLCYCHLIAAVAGSAHRITRITGKASYNVEDYGIALAEHHGAGFTARQFEEEIACVDRLSDEDRSRLIEKGEFKPIPMWNANGWLCSKLGLTVKRQTQVCQPIFHDGDLHSQTLGRVIAKGEVCGMRSAAITDTVEGIKLETESIGKVYGPGEEDTNDWVIHGEPDIYVSNEHIRNTEMICSLMVSRIVDAMNAPAGFVSTDQMQPAQYRLKPLHGYCR